MDLKICIYSQQKTGSTSLYYIINNSGFKVDKRHYNYDAIRDIPYDIIIVPFRNIKEIIISGYFENVARRKFYLDMPRGIKKILNIPIEKHIENIINYNWNKDNHYSIKGIEKTLKDIFDINLKDYKFDDYIILEKENKKLKKKSKIVLCNFIKMNTEKKDKMFTELDMKVNNINFHTNIGEKKWYNKIYIESKKLLKDNKFENLYDIKFKK